MNEGSAVIAHNSVVSNELKNVEHITTNEIELILTKPV